MTENNSKIMTPEEEEELEAMIRQRRSRGMAFYGRDPPTHREEGGIPEYRTNASSGLIRPDIPPRLNDRRVISNSSRLITGYADTIGKRPTMEDEIVISGKLRGREDEDFIAVFDGHGGKSVSEFSAKHIPLILEQKLNEIEDPEESLKQAFLRVNEMIKEQNVPGGTTALVAFFQKDICYIANAGDSRAVLCRNGQAQRLSRDHKPDDPEEEERIIRAGGTVTKMNNLKLGKTISRVNGMLAVSRALGDIFLQPYVSCEPEVTQFQFGRSTNEFLILACDGLWDVIDDEDAVDIAMGEETPELAAIQLRDSALGRASTDNISVVVIQLPGMDVGGVSKPMTVSTPLTPPRAMRQYSAPLIFVLVAVTLVTGLSYYWR